MRDIPLIEIEMSVRLDNILRKVGGYEWLSEIDDEALKKIRFQRGCGKKSYNELKNILTVYRLQEKKDIDRITEERNLYLKAIKDFRESISAIYNIANVGRFV